MSAAPESTLPLFGAEFVITRNGAVLFDHLAISSGPVMNWRGREQHGNFVVEPAQAVPVHRGERLIISGSDGTSRSIIVTESVDNVVYFRADNDAGTSTASSTFGERWAHPQRFLDGRTGRSAAGIS